MNIAVYCSSSNHIADYYLEAGRKLGEWIAANGHTLVFGGATGGLMSTVSEGAFNKNGKIIGVIPQAVINMNRQSPHCSELIEIETMSERKARMRVISDIFVVLPGSYGTLDELFDVTASAIVGEHKKQIIIVNENGFYDALLTLIDRMREEKFIPIEKFKPTIVSDTVSCINALNEASKLKI
jgi:uncharacterized protein (TIGR00730 family)